VTVEVLREPPIDGGAMGVPMSYGMFAAPVGNIKLTAVWSVAACPVDTKPTASPGAMIASDFCPRPPIDSGTHPTEAVLLVFAHSNQLPGLSVAWNVTAGAAAGVAAAGVELLEELHAVKASRQLPKANTESL
jgi:hypothetical protein